MDVERNRGEQFEFMIRELESTPFCWKIVWHDLDVASSTIYVHQFMIRSKMSADVSIRVCYG